MAAKAIPRAVTTLRAIASISFVLFALLLGAVPAASAEPVLSRIIDDNGLPTVIPQFDCNSNTLWCHVPCDNGPVSAFCDYYGTHGGASCIILIRLTSTCINPLPGQG